MVSVVWDKSDAAQFWGFPQLLKTGECKENAGVFMRTYAKVT